MKYSQEDIETFQKLLHANRYNLLKMAYIVFPFGEKGHEMEHMDLYDWQKEELQKLSLHLMNPATRFTPIASSSPLVTGRRRPRSGRS